MYYYQHNIDDFNADTARLNRLERSIYREAIELYYSKEEALTGNINKLSRMLDCRTDEEREALEYVLDIYFEIVNGFYRNKRCDEEINKYRSYQKEQSEKGKKSAITRKSKSFLSDFIGNHGLALSQPEFNRCLTVVKDGLNQGLTEAELTKELTNLITNNKKNKQKKDAPKVAVFDLEKSFIEFWDLWPKKGDTRKTALDKFKTKAKNKSGADEIMVGLRKHLPSLSAKENQFIPAASTWLNQERWNDDPEPINQNQKTGLDSMSDQELFQECEKHGLQSAGLTRWQLIDKLKKFKGDS